MKLTEKQIEYGFSKCRKCRRILEIAAFRQWRDNLGQLQRGHSCISCVQYTREGTNSRFIQKAKLKPCTDCGQSFPPECMDFDHRQGEAKLFNLSGMRTRKRTDLALEIAKCDVVCACCHRIRTRKRGYVGTGRAVSTAIRVVDLE